MKKQYPRLNDEQRRMVADHYKLAYLCASNLHSIIAANGIDTDDAVGFAWIGMCESITSFNGALSSLSTYLYMACKHAILHEVRKAGMKKRTAMRAVSSDAPITLDNGEDIGRDKIDALAAHDGDPAKIYEVKEEIKIRMSAIGERDRDIVLLSHAGYKQREIGQMYGISQGAVTQSVRKSVIRMREVAC